jgi:16S rRNA (guanine527-N7)-methyltransferase
VPENIFRYFPDLSASQKDSIEKLKSLYDYWNSRINVISRKDMDNFYVHHVLHSLAIARVVTPPARSKILDVGTGGGFPGIPLAIMFPECEFTLLDSIEKKIKVVTNIAAELGLSNVRPVRMRIEEEQDLFNIVVSRAVTSFPAFIGLVRKNIISGTQNNKFNGIYYLKGGELREEFGHYYNKVTISNISDFFEEEFFSTKKVVHLPF